MPYDLPEPSQNAATEHAAESDADAQPLVPAEHMASATPELLKQELQVRLTAQRILADHLRPGPSPRQHVTTYWGRPDSDIAIDLTGATLIDFDLSGCRIGTGRFREAMFSGDAWFDKATFSGDAGFSEATFGWKAGFGEAMFNGGARFDKATFTEPPVLDKVRVRLDAHPSAMRNWPKSLVVVEPDNDEEARLPNCEGRWGYLKAAQGEDPTNAKSLE